MSKKQPDSSGSLEGDSGKESFKSSSVSESIVRDNAKEREEQVEQQKKHANDLKSGLARSKISWLLGKFEDILPPEPIDKADGIGKTKTTGDLADNSERGQAVTGPNEAVRSVVVKVVNGSIEYDEASAQKLNSKGWHKLVDAEGKQVGLVDVYFDKKGHRVLREWTPEGSGGLFEQRFTILKDDGKCMESPQFERHRDTRKVKLEMQWNGSLVISDENGHPLKVERPDGSSVELIRGKSGAVTSYIVEENDEKVMWTRNAKSGCWRADHNGLALEHAGDVELDPDGTLIFKQAESWYVRTTDNLKAKIDVETGGHGPWQGEGFEASTFKKQWDEHANGRLDYTDLPECLQKESYRKRKSLLQVLNDLGIPGTPEDKQTLLQKLKDVAGEEKLSLAVGNAALYKALPIEVRQILESKTQLSTMGDVSGTPGALSIRQLLNKLSEGGLSSHDYDLYTKNLALRLNPIKQDLQNSIDTLMKEKKDIESYRSTVLKTATSATESGVGIGARITDLYVPALIGGDSKYDKFSSYQNSVMHALRDLDIQLNRKQNEINKVAEKLCAIEKAEAASNYMKLLAAGKRRLADQEAIGMLGKYGSEIKQFCPEAWRELTRKDNGVFARLHAFGEAGFSKLPVIQPGRPEGFQQALEVLKELACDGCSAKIDADAIRQSAFRAVDNDPAIVKLTVAANKFAKGLPELQELFAAGMKGTRGEGYPAHVRERAEQMQEAMAELTLGLSSVKERLHQLKKLSEKGSPAIDEKTQELLNKRVKAIEQMVALFDESSPQHQEIKKVLTDIGCHDIKEQYDKVQEQLDACDTNTRQKAAGLGRERVQILGEILSLRLEKERLEKIDADDRVMLSPGDWAKLSHLRKVLEEESVAKILAEHNLRSTDELKRFLNTRALHDRLQLLDRTLGFFGEAALDNTFDEATTISLLKKNAPVMAASIGAAVGTMVFAPAALTYLGVSKGVAAGIGFVLSPLGGIVGSEVTAESLYQLRMNDMLSWGAGRSQAGDWYEKSFVWDAETKSYRKPEFFQDVALSYAEQYVTNLAYMVATVGVARVAAGAINQGLSKLGHAGAEKFLAKHSQLIASIDNKAAQITKEITTEVGEELGKQAGKGKVADFVREVCDEFLDEIKEAGTEEALAWALSSTDSTLGFCASCLVAAKKGVKLTLDRSNHRMTVENQRQLIELTKTLSEQGIKFQESERGLVVGQVGYSIPVEVQSEGVITDRVAKTENDTLYEPTVDFERGIGKLPPEIAKAVVEATKFKDCVAHGDVKQLAAFVQELDAVTSRWQDISHLPESVRMEKVEARRSELQALVDQLSAVSGLPNVPVEITPFFNPTGGFEKLQLPESLFLDGKTSVQLADILLHEYSHFEQQCFLERGFLSNLPYPVKTDAGSLMEWRNDFTSAYERQMGRKPHPRLLEHYSNQIASGVDPRISPDDKLAWERHSRLGESYQWSGYVLDTNAQRDYATSQQWDFIQLAILDLNQNGVVNRESLAQLVKDFETVVPAPDQLKQLTLDESSSKISSPEQVLILLNEWKQAVNEDRKTINTRYHGQYLEAEVMTYEKLGRLLAMAAHDQRLSKELNGRSITKAGLESVIENWYGELEPDTTTDSEIPHQEMTSNSGASEDFSARKSKVEADASMLGLVLTRYGKESGEYLISRPAKFDGQIFLKKKGQATNDLTTVETDSKLTLEEGDELVVKVDGVVVEKYELRQVQALGLELQQTLGGQKLFSYERKAVDMSESELVELGKAAGLDLMKLSSPESIDQFAGLVKEFSSNLESDIETLRTSLTSDQLAFVRSCINDGVELPSSASDAERRYFKELKSRCEALQTRIDRFMQERGLPPVPIELGRGEGASYNRATGKIKIPFQYFDSLKYGEILGLEVGHELLHSEQHDILLRRCVEKVAKGRDAAQLTEADLLDIEVMYCSATGWTPPEFRLKHALTSYASKSMSEFLTEDQRQFADKWATSDSLAEPVPVNLERIKLSQQYDIVKNELDRIRNEKGNFADTRQFLADLLSMSSLERSKAIGEYFSGSRDISLVENLLKHVESSGNLDNANVLAQVRIARLKQLAMRMEAVQSRWNSKQKEYMETLEPGALLQEERLKVMLRARFEKLRSSGAQIFSPEEAADRICETEKRIAKNQSKVENYGTQLDDYDETAHQDMRFDEHAGLDNSQQNRNYLLSLVEKFGAVDVPANFNRQELRDVKNLAASNQDCWLGIDPAQKQCMKNNLSVLCREKANDFKLALKNVSERNRQAIHSLMQNLHHQAVEGKIPNSKESAPIKLSYQALFELLENPDSPPRDLPPLIWAGLLYKLDVLTDIAERANPKNSGNSDFYLRLLNSNLQRNKSMTTFSDTIEPTEVDKDNSINPSGGNENCQSCVSAYLLNNLLRNSERSEFLLKHHDELSAVPVDNEDVPMITADTVEAIFGSTAVRHDTEFSAKGSAMGHVETALETALGKSRLNISTSLVSKPGDGKAFFYSAADGHIWCGYAELDPSSGKWKHTFIDPQNSIHPITPENPNYVKYTVAARFYVTVNKT